MKRSLTKGFSSAGNRILSNAGDLAQDVAKSTGLFVLGVSKSIARIRWKRLYSGARKKARFIAKRSNRSLVRTFRTFRKTALYNKARNFPVYFSLLRKFSRFKLRRLRNSTLTSYKITRRWVVKNAPRMDKWLGRRRSLVSTWFKIQYPKVRRFVLNNYPRLEKFVLTQVPVYRAAFA